MQTICVSPDPDRPGMYLLGIVLRYLSAGEVEVDLVSWRQVRREGDPEAYITLCRDTFAHWCARNGYP
jgi:hypothetical protein